MPKPILLFTLLILSLPITISAQNNYYHTYVIQQMEITLPDFYDVESPAAGETRIYVDPPTSPNDSVTTLTIKTHKTDDVLPTPLMHTINSNRDVPVDYEDATIDGVPALWTAFIEQGGGTIYRHMITVWQGTTYDVTLTAPATDNGKLQATMLWAYATGNTIFVPDENKPYFSQFSSYLPELVELPAQVNVNWSLENRPDNSNLQFVQVADNGNVINVELSRQDIYVKSSGSGDLDLRHVDDSPYAKIQVRLIDITTGELHTVRQLLLPISSLTDDLPMHSPDTNIQNFTFGYGSDDGVLRMDTMVNFQWLVQSVSDAQLIVYSASGDASDEPITTLDLPTNVYNSVDYLMSDLVPDAGQYRLTLVVSDEDFGEETQSYDTEVFPAVTLPAYVEQAWIDAASVIRTCYIRGDNATVPVTWRLTNPNPDLINSEPPVRVVFDWYVANVVGDRLQSGTGETTGVFELDAMPEYTLLVTSYLDINNGQYRYRLGEDGVIVNPSFLCQS